MLSIFSCAFWPPVCLLWRNVYLALRPFSAFKSPWTLLSVPTRDTGLLPKSVCPNCNSLILNNQAFCLIIVSEVYLGWPSFSHFCWQPKLWKCEGFLQWCSEVHFPASWALRGRDCSRGGPSFRILAELPRCPRGGNSPDWSFLCCFGSCFWSPSLESAPSTLLLTLQEHYSFINSISNH